MQIDTAISLKTQAFPNLTFAILPCHVSRLRDIQISVYFLFDRNKLRMRTGTRMHFSTSPDSDGRAVRRE